MYAAAITLAGLLAGCSETGDSAPAPDTSVAAPIGETTSASPDPGTPIRVSVPPAADNAVPGKVAFDPCFRVEDVLIEQAGFDAGSRERNAAEFTDFPSKTEVGCTFFRYGNISGETTLTGALHVMTSTTTLADVTGNERHEVIDTAPINGRPAVVFRLAEEIMMPSCEAAVEAPDGTLQITVDKPPSPVAVPEPCDQIREIAETIATALDS